MQTLVTETEEKRYAELQQMALDYARLGETESLAAMLRHVLPVNLADGKGNTLLMLASYHGNLVTTRMLLAHGADVNAKDLNGKSPLYHTTFHKAKASAKVVRSLATRNRFWLGMTIRVST